LPAATPLRHQALDECSIVRELGDVGVLLGVGLMIAKFDGVDLGGIVACHPDGETVVGCKNSSGHKPGLSKHMIV
jgi:hypothetical protein